MECIWFAHRQQVHENFQDHHQEAQVRSHAPGSCVFSSFFDGFLIKSVIQKECTGETQTDKTALGPWLWGTSAWHADKDSNLRGYGWRRYVLKLLAATTMFATILMIIEIGNMV